MNNRYINKNINNGNNRNNGKRILNKIYVNIKT
jgi:hypothetical protein